MLVDVQDRSILATGCTQPRLNKELQQALSRPSLVSLRRFTRTHQVAQRLVLGIGNPHRRQVPSPQRTRQLLRVAPVRLPLGRPRFIGISVGATAEQRTPSFAICQYST